MAESSTSIVINRAPEDVWKVVSDVGGIAEWMPMIAESRFDGERRHCALEGGGSLVEQILVNDDATRTLEYTIAESPLPLESYVARWTVAADGDGSKVTWHTEIEPADAADGMKPVAEGGLAALKAHLEG